MRLSTDFCISENHISKSLPIAFFHGLYSAQHSNNEDGTLQLKQKRRFVNDRHFVLYVFRKFYRFITESTGLIQFRTKSHAHTAPGRVHYNKLT